MNAEIKPGKAVGTAAAPPSKSFAHRLMICAALAQGESTVRGISKSEDMLATLDCIKALGAKFDLQGDTLKVNGSCKKATPPVVFNCRESGSTLRFFIPLSLVFADNVCFKGSARLMERGVGVYEDILTLASFEKNPDSINISGKLAPGEYTVPGNISSQYISGLLFALPLLEGTSKVTVVPPIESRPYIDITLSVLEQFKIVIKEISDGVFKIEGGQKYKSRDITVEADWSNAAFLHAFNCIGGNVTVSGLNYNSIQGDKICLEHFKAIERSMPVIDISDCPDLGPVLFALAAAKNGAVFTGTARLKIKECDRGEAMAQELAKFGIKTAINENSITVHGGKLSAPALPLCGHNDHRIVMALSVLSSITGAKIEGAQAVSKSYPDFFETLKTLGLEVIYEA
ncbi:MAG: 3-phosphoshikimate 1-carboxyvinyltransferase [Clostridia bacterium]|nr:3-phosphoshikimate 1-carboxyvinyltransferase [Clostridia bacterium]